MAYSIKPSPYVTVTAQWLEHPTGNWTVVGSIPATRPQIIFITYHFSFITLGRLVGSKCTQHCLSPSACEMQVI